MEVTATGQGRPPGKGFMMMCDFNYSDLEKALELIWNRTNT